MHPDPALIQTQVRAQFGDAFRGTKRKQDDGPQYPTQLPNHVSEASNLPLKTPSNGKRGSRRPVALGAQLPIQGTQEVEPPPTKHSIKPDFQHWPTQPPRPDDLGYQTTQSPRGGQRQQVETPIADNGAPTFQSSTFILTPPHSPSTPSHTSSASSHEPWSPSLPNGSFLPFAHNFSMSNPTFSDNSIHTNVWDVGVKNHAILELARHSLPGAEFDSSARDPPPRCHPGTRLNIIDGIGTWSKSSDRKLSLLWLYGPAGAGKSAIMQTLAESVGGTATLGASLFFSRLNGRANPHFVIPTLAYQLAIHIPEYRDYVSKLIGLDPSIPCKSIEQQFRKLIVEPLSMLQFYEKGQCLLMLIDGLDECEGEQAQSELVNLIASFSRDFPTPPLLWVISSRPEPHLQHAFARYEVEKMEVPVDSSEACKDVEAYLRKGFARIRELSFNLIPVESQWPSERQFLVIARAAGGLFVFATTLLSFLGDGSSYGDPVSQLDLLLLVLDRFEPKEHEGSPFASLDTLYKHILLTVPHGLISTLHQILGFHLFKGPFRSTSLMLTANILDMKQNVVYSTLQRLHSVLEIPQPHEANKRPLRFLHKSFGDFLVNSNRSGPFWLDMGKQCIKICQRYTQKLGLILEKGSLAIPLSWAPPTEIDLNTQLLCEVKQNWYQVISKMLIKWGTSNCEGELGRFLDVFGNLDFSAFDVSDALGFINLINWVKAGSVPSLWQKIIIEELPLENFNTDLVDDRKTSVFYRTKPLRWGRYTTNLDASKNVDIPLGKQYPRNYEKHSLSKKDFFEDLHDLKKTSYSSTPMVLIVGLNPSRRCAVVLTPEDKHQTKPLVRYYLPLIKDAKWT